MYVRTTSSALTTPNQLLSVDVPHCAQSEWMSERVDVPLLDWATNAVAAAATADHWPCSLSWHIKVLVSSPPARRTFNSLTVLVKKSLSFSRSLSVDYIVTNVIQGTRTVYNCCSLSVLSASLACACRKLPLSNNWRVSLLSVALHQQHSRDGNCVWWCLKQELSLYSLLLRSEIVELDSRHGTRNIWTAADLIVKLLD